MSKGFPTGWFARTASTLAALRIFLLGLLVLWYSRLPVVLLGDMTRDRPALAELASCMLAGAMSARLVQRVWAGPMVAALLLFLLEAVVRAERSDTIAGAGDIAQIAFAFSVWAGLATATASLLRRYVSPALRDRPSLQAAIAAAASIATGLIVLLHPGMLGPLSAAFDLGAVSLPPADVVIACYYSLGGLAAGFTLKLLWPSRQRLPYSPAVLLTGTWCALASSTLLDVENQWSDLYPATTLPALSLLAPIAVAAIAGVLLARWPSRWSRDA